MSETYWGNDLVTKGVPPSFPDREGCMRLGPSMYHVYQTVQIVFIAWGRGWSRAHQMQVVTSKCVTCGLRPHDYLSAGPQGPWATCLPKRRAGDLLATKTKENTGMTADIAITKDEAEGHIGGFVIDPDLWSEVEVIMIPPRLRLQVGHMQTWEWEHWHPGRSLRTTRPRLYQRARLQG